MSTTLCRISSRRTSRGSTSATCEAVTGRSRQDDVDGGGTVHPEGEDLLDVARPAGTGDADHPARQVGADAGEALTQRGDQVVFAHDGQVGARDEARRARAADPAGEDE